jgi:hypothetical protein
MDTLRTNLVLLLAGLASGGFWAGVSDAVAATDLPHTNRAWGEILTVVLIGAFSQLLSWMRAAVHAREQAAKLRAELGLPPAPPRPSRRKKKA